MECVLVFTAQFFAVFLLGIQSLNVRDGRYIAAAITSFLLGVFGFVSTSIVGSKEVVDIVTSSGLSFLFAGPIGIVSAMASHNKIINLFRMGEK